MSLRDIILDQVEEKLYEDLCKGPLKKWGKDHLDDMADAVIRAHRKKIKSMIADKIKQENLNLVTWDDSVIDDLIDEIETSVLVLDDSVDPYLGFPNAKNQPDFPFNTRSLLQMCWGLTLNLSHGAQEQTIGGDFNTLLTAEWGKVSRLDVDLNNSTGLFLMNLQMALSSTIRNLSLIRDSNTAYLNYNNDRMLRRRQNLEEVADLASFSDTSLFSKIGSFLGGGAVTTSILATIKWTNNLDLLFLIFVAAGVLGAVIISQSVRLYINHTEDSFDRNVRLEMNRYWKEHYKKDVINELYNLFISIIGLIEKFYPKEKNDIMDHDELLSMRGDPEKVKDIIRKFLAPDNLQWFPGTQANASPPSTSDQTSTSSGQTSTSSQTTTS